VMQCPCHGRVRSIRMDDLGAPGSHMTLRQGMPVYARDGQRLGDVAQVLAPDSAAAERLPDPSENPATLSASPDDTAEGGLERKLRRAWDLISGR
jgi:hypothetical protein